MKQGTGDAPAASTCPSRHHHPMCHGHRHLLPIPPPPRHNSLRDLATSLLWTAVFFAGSWGLCVALRSMLCGEGRRDCGHSSKKLPKDSPAMKDSHGLPLVSGQSTSQADGGVEVHSVTVTTFSHHQRPAACGPYPLPRTPPSHSGDFRASSTPSRSPGHLADYVKPKASTPRSEPV